MIWLLGSKGQLVESESVVGKQAKSLLFLWHSLVTFRFRRGGRWAIACHL